MTYFISLKRRSCLTMLMIISLFADTDPAVVEHVLNKELVVVCEWFRNNKMILNAEKCKALVLSRKPNVKLSLFAKGVALLLVDTVDLFGLTLDDSLKFENTLRKLARKLESNQMFFVVSDQNSAFIIRS